MKAKVQELGPSNKAEREIAVREARELYPLEFTEHLFESTPKRLESVIKNNGRRIKY